MISKPASPRVSVVMTAYNAAAYVGEAVESILSQTYSGFEFIIIDDGSIDDTPDILARYASTDSRLIIVNQQNTGVTRASRRGIDMARGEYIARMDADDIAWPERFTKQIAVLDADPTLVALGSQVRLVDPEGRALKVLPAPLSHEDVDAAHISGKGQSVICQPTVMMRTDALRRVGSYNTALQTSMDIDIFLRLAEVGKIQNLPDVLLDYRQHANSVGYARRSQQIKDAWQAVQDAAERRQVTLQHTEPPTDSNRKKNTDIWRMWGWWALSGGNVATARHYAWKVLRVDPLSRSNWHFAVIALRGY